MKRSSVVLLLFIGAVVLAASSSAVQCGSSTTSLPIFNFLHHFATPDYVEPADSSSGLCVRSWQQAEDREPTVIMRSTMALTDFLGAAIRAPIEPENNGVSHRPQE